MIDLQLIDKGQHYKKLNRSYIIFISLFDLYGKGRHIYTFENICREDNNISMGDEAVKEARRNREWRHEYMTLLMRDQENVEKGREYGEELMITLIQMLITDKRFDEIDRIKEDKNYRLRLYREYHIV